MKKAGYIVILIGIIVIALSFKEARDYLSITLPAGISDYYVLIAGVIIIVLGAVFSRSRMSRKVAEVPIYHGKNVVGFRRLGR